MPSSASMASQLLGRKRARIAPRANQTRRSNAAAMKYAGGAFWRCPATMSVDAAAMANAAPISGRVRE
jgi:hypothetical protein